MPNTRPQPLMLEPLEPRSLLVIPAIPVINNAFTVTDTDGDLVTVRLTGPGTLAARDSNGIARISRLDMTGTSASSTLTVSVTKKAGGDGFVSLAHMTTDGDLNLLNASKADVSEGLLEFAGRVKEIKLRDIFASSLTMGGNLAESVKFTARRTIGMSMNFGARLVSSFRVDGMSETQISAGAIGTWLSNRVNGVGGTGDLAQIQVNLSGVAGVARTLNSMSFAGNMTDSLMLVTGAVGSITGAAIVNSEVELTGSIQTLKTTLGQLQGLFSALYFKTINVKGLLDAELSANSASENAGVSFGSIRADAVHASVTVFQKFSAGARVGSFQANQITRLNMIVGSVGSFKVAGDALDTHVQVRAGDRTQQIDSFTVGRVFAGDLVVRQSAGNLSLGAVDDAVILVGVTPGIDNPEDFRDLGLSADATGLFSTVPAGTIKSLTFPKPKASSGFNAGNPNLGAYWVLARQIDKFNSFGRFATTNNAGVSFGLGVHLIKSFSLTIDLGTYKTSNLDGAKLESLAASDPDFVANTTTAFTETGIVNGTLAGDAKLRMYL